MRPIVYECGPGLWLWAQGAAAWLLDVEARSWLPMGEIKPGWSARILPRAAVEHLVALFGAPRASNRPALH